MEHMRLRQDTLDEIAVDSLLYHYRLLKERGAELRALNKSELVEFELIQLGKDLRAFEGVLEYFGVGEPVESLKIYVEEHEQTVK